MMMMMMKVLSYRPVERSSLTMLHHALTVTIQGINGRIMVHFVALAPMASFTSRTRRPHHTMSSPHVRDAYHVRDDCTRPKREVYLPSN